MFLVVIAVPTERDQRMKVVRTRGEAAEYVMKLKMYIQGIKAEVYKIGEACESFS